MAVSKVNTFCHPARHLLKHTHLAGKLHAVGPVCVHDEQDETLNEAPHLGSRRPVKVPKARGSSAAEATCVQGLCQKDLSHHGLVEVRQGQRPLKVGHGDQDLGSRGHNKQVPV